MGEPRVRVRLANAADESLSRRDQLPKSEVRQVEVEAVVDTGAVRSCMPETLMRRLGLMEQSRQVARCAGGRTDTVIISEPVTVYILDREVSENFLVLGDEVLLGQTALEATDLLVDCARQQVIANPDHPNAPVIRIR
jgi:clan AA aspartic protease